LKASPIACVVIMPSHACMRKRDARDARKKLHAWSLTANRRYAEVSATAVGPADNCHGVANGPYPTG
jgi:hypothetical protein